MFASLVQARQRPQQADGVGVPWVGINVLDAGSLHDVAGIHDNELLGHSSDYPQVVGDPNDGHANVVPEPLHKLNDLSLDSDVQGSGGLVGDEYAGVAGEGHSDHHPLTHSARELVGIIIGAVRCLRDAHHLQELDGALAGLMFVHAHV